MSATQPRANVRYLPKQDDQSITRAEDSQDEREFKGLKRPPVNDPLLTVQQVAERLNVTKDWVWDHSSRKTPLLPVIRMGDGTLRYRETKIEEFINERERLSVLRLKRR